MTQFDTLELYPTNHCQMHCTHCFLNANKNEWTEEQAQRILDSNVLRRVSKSISISGGEPTLWEPLLDFVDAVREQSPTLPIVVSTNAKRLAEDRDYLKSFVDCCKKNGVSVNVSWHEDNLVLAPFYVLLKEKLLNNILVTPSYDLNLYKEMFEHFHKAHKSTLWTSLVVNEKYKNLSRKVNSFLKEQRHASNKRRIVDGKSHNNFELIQRAVERDNFYYGNYECKCGRNGLVYTNARLYHCLTQALKMHKPLSITNETSVTWVKCSFPTCYGYDFELRTAKKQGKT